MLASSIVDCPVPLAKTENGKTPYDGTSDNLVHAQTPLLLRNYLNSVVCVSSGTLRATWGKHKPHYAYNG